MMISVGSKVSDFGGGPDHKSKVYPSSRYWGPEIFCMQTRPGVIYKIHMVSLGSVPMMCFAQKKTPKKVESEVAESEVTKFFQLALGNESPSPVEL